MSTTNSQPFEIPNHYPKGLGSVIALPEKRSANDVEEEEEEEEEELDRVQPNKGVKIFVEPTNAVRAETNLSSTTPIETMVIEKEPEKPVQPQSSPIIQVDPVSTDVQLVKSLVDEAIDSAEESLSRESTPDDEHQFRTPPNSISESQSQQHSPRVNANNAINLYLNADIKQETLALISSDPSSPQLIGYKDCCNPDKILSEPPPPLENQLLLLKIVEKPPQITPGFNPTESSVQPLQQNPQQQQKPLQQEPVQLSPVVQEPTPKPAPRTHRKSSSQNEPTPPSVDIQQLPISNIIQPLTMINPLQYQQNVNPLNHQQNMNNVPNYAEVQLPSPIKSPLIRDSDLRKISVESTDSQKFTTRPKDESSWIVQDSVTTNRLSKGAPWVGKGVGPRKVWQVDQREGAPIMQPMTSPPLRVPTSLAPARSEPNLNNSKLEQPVVGSTVVLPTQVQLEPPKRMGAIASLGQRTDHLPPRNPPPNPPNQLFVNTESPQVTPVNSAQMTPPWSQKNWKSVSAPNSQFMPFISQQQLYNQQSSQVPQQNFNPSLSPQNFNPSQPQQNFNTSIKKQWTPVQSPVSPHAPSSFPQKQQVIGQQLQSPVKIIVQENAVEDVPTPPRAPPPIMPKPKLNLIKQQQAPQQDQVHDTEPGVDRKEPPTVTQARAQFEPPGTTLRHLPPMLNRPGNQWPPPKPERAEGTPPRQLVQNVEIKPDTKQWTLTKPAQSEIKAQLETVISKPGVRSSLRAKSAEEEPEEFPKLRKVEQSSVSPKPSPTQVENDEEVEHLLKPSEIKATQPKIEDIVGSSGNLSKSPKNVTKEALLNQYNAVWDKADRFEEPEVVKCGLPATKRPAEPENNTDVEACIRRLVQNDPTLTEVNLNNMKRTPIPQIQRLIDALNNNTNLKKLSLANLGLTDVALEPLLEVIEHNPHLESLNIETNFLNGEFLVRFFQSCLVLQSLRDIKAVNQSPTFSNQAELNMMKAIHQNRGLWKVSLNLRLPEARQKVDQALIRNGELRRLKRKIEAMETEGD